MGSDRTGNPLKSGQKSRFAEAEERAGVSQKGRGASRPVFAALPNGCKSICHRALGRVQRAMSPAIVWSVAPAFWAGAPRRILVYYPLFPLAAFETLAPCHQVGWQLSALSAPAV